MTSVSENWGLRCPRCNSDSGLCITAEVVVVLHPDGTDPLDGCREWTDYSPCYCAACGFEGIVASFKLLEAETTEVSQ